MSGGRNIGPAQWWLRRPVNFLITIVCQDAVMEHVAPETFRIDADHWPSILSRLTVETANDYGRFRRSLTADYAIVWRDLALGYGALAVIVALVALVPGVIGGLAAAVCGAVAIGIAIAYLQLFIHEAAHWNLAADRARSDRIADALISWQVGTSIAAYRRVHFDHHRHLGHHDDGERSYTHALSWRLIVEMLTGIHAMRIFLVRAQQAPAAGSGAQAPDKSIRPLLRGVVVHGVLLIGMLCAGAWASALAWIGGMAIVFPLLATLRPLLEHRPAASDSNVLSGPRHAVTRIFDDGVLARIFGGAGFNRHLLHHWEPQVSYTRLADLDHYLARTSVGTIIDARRTTYLQAFRDILASDHGR